MSHVYYKFKSQRDPSRVVFDGPAISVFDLKREIIILNKLNKGVDFDLSIYDESTNEEFTDDNSMIPRTSSVIARRLPPSKPGKGNGAKYVTGIVGPPNRNSHVQSSRKTNEAKVKSSSPTTSRMALSPTSGIADGKSASDDENAAIAAIMAAQSANWDSALQKMSMVTPVYNRIKPLAPVPDRPPPQGYICHRCGEKGHWIQACPTNSNPNFDNKPRIKRTTGIPKMFLKKADKPVFDEDGDGKTNGVMLNDDGQYVIFEPDSKSWATYQAKASASEDDVYSQALPAEHKDWGCQICGGLLRDATRTPCCEKLYCDEDIQTTLLESDFVCPGCGSQELLLGALVADENVRSQINEYIKKRNGKRKSTSPLLDAKNVLRNPASSQVNSQVTSNASTPSRKRSRSSTPTGDASNKKVAYEPSNTTTSDSQGDSKRPLAATGATTEPIYRFDQQFNKISPGVSRIPFPAFPPDPFVMAAIGIPPPPLPGMMAPFHATEPGIIALQDTNQQMGNRLYAEENIAYMRPYVNDGGIGLA